MYQGEAASIWDINRPCAARYPACVAVSSLNVLPQVTPWTPHPPNGPETCTWDSRVEKTATFGSSPLSCCMLQSQTLLKPMLSWGGALLLVILCSGLTLAPASVQHALPLSCTILREFVKLTSSWPPARVEGGSELRLLPPLPVDPLDPLDLLDLGMSSKN